MQSFMQKEKKKRGPKTPYLDIFGLKLIVIFEISSLKFFKMKIFIQNKKTVKLKPKMPLLGIFKLEFEKSFVAFDASALEFFRYFKSFVQNKKLQIWNQKSLVWVFLAKNLKELLLP